MTDEPLAFGDIVLVPFPFTDLSASKRRPAVIISGRDYNQARRDVVLMAVTSQLYAKPDFGEVRVSDWQGAGLLKASAIKPVITTLETRMILRRMGSLLQADRTALREALDQIFADAPSV
ncbi:type II toxin-antitoxin system PemK/MazF family toxin [Brevundimonas sp.]|uniref:type II toxin-antitoxin system PemK/MazF family toxin n=1 Tax=Brevundimonas sp. TaxID=1871086 RepID=UPI001A1EC387|nr:type II toxin-antitoxin system PemK/MazF family toxin [Brevundimonas sp.]MBJ7483376.1 type II toxin-antitoxin system PemK/MazF family toxin [Brevundimonas sp.]